MGPGGTATTIISDTPPVGAANGALWWESDTGYLYAWYNDGTSSQWVMVGPGGGMVPPATVAPIMDGAAVVGVATKYAREDHVHPSDTTKLSKASNLSDVANIVTSRQSIYAAPFDAMAYSGMQVNGNFDVFQTGSGSTSLNATYICDGWVLGKLGPSVTPAAVYGGTPTGGLTVGQNYFLGITVSTAEAALAASSFVLVRQSIEGYRVTRLGWGTPNAQPLTVGFWSDHHRPGIYSVAVNNASANRSYATTYTHNVADGPQYNVVTIPGDTAGTWAIDNTIGLVIDFPMACGTTYQVPTANVWTAGNLFAAPGQINGVAATSDIFRIGGVVVLPGIEAPSAARAPLIMRPYDQELLTCKRYWQKLEGVIVDTSTVSQTTIFQTAMRANPTVAGGGAGFVVGSLFTGSAQFYQTARAYQTLSLDARL
jgi:hypothetical protein